MYTFYMLIISMATFQSDRRQYSETKLLFKSDKQYNIFSIIGKYMIIYETL